MALALAPLLLGIPGAIAGIMDAVRAGKQLNGGQIRMLKMLRAAHHRKYAAMRHGGKVRRYRKRHGRGVAANIAGAIPLIGPLLGPLVKMMGGRVKHRYHRKRKGGYVPYTFKARGLLAPAGGMVHHYSGAIVHRKGYYKHVNGHRVHVRPSIAHVGHGGALTHRKGHYRHVNGHRVHVRGSIVHKAAGFAPMYIQRPYVGMGLRRQKKRKY